MTESPFDLVLSKLERVKVAGNGQATARCPVPAHEDRANSLSVTEGNDGRALLRCHAGCDTASVVAAVNLEMKDLFPAKGRGGGGGIPPNNTSTRQHSAGCTLAQYAAAKHLDVDFLRGLGLTDISYSGQPAVRIPYFDATGAEAAVRFRVALTKGADGDDRFRWKSGAKPCLYGLNRLDYARERGYVTIVEGESDCHTLWHYGEPAVGLPGANNWKEERDASHLDGIPLVYVVVEPDKGGEAVRKWLATSRLRHWARLVALR